VVASKRVTRLPKYPQHAGNVRRVQWHKGA